MTCKHLTAAAAVILVVSAARAADTTTVRATVERVDAAAGRLTVSSADGGALTLQVTKDSTVTVDGRAAKLGDLSHGQRVKATYREAGGSNQLVSASARTTTGRDVAREAREALQAAGRYTFQQKDEYEKRLQSVVNDLDDRIDDLQRRTKEASQDGRRKLEDRIHDLKQKRGVVEDRLKRVKSAGADAWDDVKTGVQNAVDDLRRALDGDGSRPN